MEKIKRRFLPVVAVCLIAALAVGFLFRNSTDPTVVDGNFSDFWADGDKAYIKCNLCIANKSDEAKTVNISAESAEDVIVGLLKDKSLIAYDENLETTDIVISPGTDFYTVVFVGEFGGDLRKADRLPPNDIHVTVRDTV